MNYYTPNSFHIDILLIFTIIIYYTGGVPYPFFNGNSLFTFFIYFYFNTYFFFINYYNNHFNYSSSLKPVPPVYTVNGLLFKPTTSFIYKSCPSLWFKYTIINIQIDYLIFQNVKINTILQILNVQYLLLNL